MLSRAIGTRGLFLVAFVPALGSVPAHAALSPVSFTGSYSQNFDSLGTSGTSLDTAALQGWSANNASSQTDQSASPTGQVIKAVDITPGATASGPSPATLSVAGPINYGSTGGTNDADRAFGSRASTNTGAGWGNQILELQLTNSTGSAISSFDLLYDGELWVNSGGTGLVAYFSPTGAANSYVAMGSAFNYTPSVAGIAGDTWEGKDGNLAINRTAGIGGTYTPASAIAAGSTFFIRWFDVNDGGVSDKGLAIDNVTLAVPEPASLALLGLGGLMCFRRR